MLAAPQESLARRALGKRDPAAILDVLVARTLNWRVSYLIEVIGYYRVVDLRNVRLIWAWIKQALRFIASPYLISLPMNNILRITLHCKSFTRAGRPINEYGAILPVQECVT